jgi:hypothetical protein
MKIKTKHVIIVLGAIGFLLMANLCSVDGSDFETQKQEVQDLHDSKDSLYSIADDLIRDISMKEFEYNYNIDSLNQLIDDGSLTQDEQDSLKKEIERTKRLLEREKKRLENLPHEIERRDSVVYNIIKKDSIVYNIIYKDTIILRKRVVKSEHDMPRTSRPPNDSTPMKSDEGGDKKDKKNKKKN